MLEILAGDRIPVVAYQFSWLGVGHVSKACGGFRYDPAPLSPMRAAS